MVMQLRIILLLLPLILSTSCSLHETDLEPQPLLTAPLSYSIPSPERQLPERLWWQGFEENQLNSLIELALADNFTIAQAVERLSQATSVHTQSSAALLPQVGIGAFARQDWDKEGKLDSDNTGGGVLDWELDFFGRLRSEVLAKKYLEEAAAEGIEGLRLTISRAVVDTFFDIVEQRQQLLLLQQQLKTDQELLDLVKLRFRHGVASQVDVLQQRSQVNEAQGLIPLTQANLRLAENTLDNLLGKPADGVNRVAEHSDFPEKLGAISVGIPSDLLLRRPDLRKLQAAVIAVDADIGRAIAERLPIVTLSGSALFATGSGSSGVVSELLAQILMPVIDWGSREAEVKRVKSQFREALLAFTQGYIDAISEVENGLYQLARQKEFLNFLAERQEILNETVAEARKRYTAGVTDYLPVLDAAKELRRTERDTLRQKRELLRIQTQVLVAVGGTLPQGTSD